MDTSINTRVRCSTTKEKDNKKQKKCEKGQITSEMKTELARKSPKVCRMVWKYFVFETKKDENPSHWKKTQTLIITIGVRFPTLQNDSLGFLLSFYLMAAAISFPPCGGTSYQPPGPLQWPLEGGSTWKSTGRCGFSNGPRRQHTKSDSLMILLNDKCP